MNTHQIRVLMSPDNWIPPDERVEMPESLGRWIKRPVFKKGRPVRWRFELTDEGERMAAEVRALVEAANDALASYIDSEHRSNCFPGAFRDGFARGVHWSKNMHAYAVSLRRAAEAAIEAIDCGDEDEVRRRLKVVLDATPQALDDVREAYPLDTAVYLVGHTPANNILTIVGHVPPGGLKTIIDALHGDQT